MFTLTRQEQLIIVSIIAALLLGAVVKHWRQNQPRLQQSASRSVAENQ